MTKVSVIIPAYNAGPFLEQAVRSIQAQTHTDHEIVVVDDGSTDDTAKVMAAFGDGIIPVYQENQGAAAARNAGVAASSGSYLAFLDADDWIAPDKLATQSRYLDSHPDVGLVAGGLEIVDAQGRHLSVHKPWVHVPVITLQALTFVGLVGVHGVLLRREAFDRVGGFDTAITHVEDMDLWWRLMVAGCRFAWLPGIVGSYRVHGTSLSQGFQRHHDKSIALMDRQLMSGMLSSSALSQRSGVVARIKVALAGRLYGSDDFAGGARALLDAIALDPAMRDPHRMSEAIAHWRDDPWAGNKNQVIDRALANLPPALAWLADCRKLVDRYYYRYRFYTAALDADWPEIARAWLALVVEDPRWALHKGGWSILFGRRRPLVSGEPQES